jgi:hypothetical protein
MVGTPPFSVAWIECAPIDEPIKEKVTRMRQREKHDDTYWETGHMFNFLLRTWCIHQSSQAAFHHFLHFSFGPIFLLIFDDFPKIREALVQEP